MDVPEPQLRMSGLKRDTIYLMNPCPAAHHTPRHITLRRQTMMSHETSTAPKLSPYGEHPIMGPRRNTDFTFQLFFFGIWCLVSLLQDPLSQDCVS